MKHQSKSTYPSVFTNLIRVSTILLTLCLISNSSTAQNISYNLNSVPIAGSYNCAFGYLSLNNTTGEYNAALGYYSLHSNTTGVFNTAIGANSLYHNTFGNYNTATGNDALTSTLSGGYNTGTGASCLSLNVYGNYNTASGAQALYNNYTGNYNTAVGFQSNYSNSSGYNNTSIGCATLINNLYGYNNTAIGDSAGYLNSGSGNVFVGHKAGRNEPGNNKMYIGNDVSKTLLYGDLSTGQLLLGNQNPTGYIFKGNRTLNVIGGIISDSVRVALSSTWADYVFADNYKLRPLNELDAYIKAYKHLPNIPGADEVKKNGIDVSDMNAKLLEKIEELHLYVLQLQKQSEVQGKQMAAQQKQIDILKTLMESK